MPFQRIASVTDVPPGKAKPVPVSGKTIGLFNIGGTYHAIDDLCPHRGASLSEGEVQGMEVICPWHGAGFDLTTGAHLCPPANCGVKVYRVQVVGEEVQVEV